MNRTLFDEHVLKRGFILGCSVDFWIVFLTCTLGMSMSFLLMWACVNSRTTLSQESALLSCAETAVEEVSESNDDEEDSLVDEDDMKNPQGVYLLSSSRDRDAFSSPPAFQRGFVQRVLFQENTNPGFAFGMDLSLRGALACTFCSLGYWAPCMMWMNSYGWSMQYAAVIVCFTLYKSAGSTWSLACSGFVGTAIAVVNAIIMFRYYPAGVEDGGKEAGIFGGINFVLFAAVILWYNFPTNARMFALSWQAYFTMCFLNPTNKVIFSKGVRDVNLYGAATGPLMGTVIGIVLSILCNLLPQALGFGVMSALATAQEIALDVAWKEGAFWNKMVAAIATPCHTLELKAFSAELAAIMSRARKIDSALAESWWECGDLGRCGRMRAYLAALKSSWEMQHIALQQAFMAVQLAQEDSSTLGQACSFDLMPALQRLARHAGILEQAVVRAAVSGNIDQETQARIHSAMDACDTCQRQLAAVISTSWKSNVLTPTHVPPAAFAHALSSYAKFIRDFAEVLLLDELPAGIGPARAFVNGLRDLPGGNPFKKDCSYALRALVTFFMTFYFGWVGATDIFPSFNSTPPGTVAYLLSGAGHAGSALKKNMDRFIGVGLGTMMGQFCFVLMCKAALMHPYFKMWFTCVMFYGFETCSFYVYYFTENYAYVGLLVACFGAEHMLMSCSPYQEQNRDEAVYQNLMGQFVAIITSACMDTKYTRVFLFGLVALVVHEKQRMDGNGFGTTHGQLDFPMLLKVTFVTLAMGLAYWLERILGNTPGSVLATSALDRFRVCLVETLSHAVHVHLEDDVKACGDSNAEELRPQDDVKSLGVSGLALLSMMADEGKEAGMEPRVSKTPWKAEVWTKIMESSSNAWTATCWLEHLVQSRPLCREVLTTSPKITGFTSSLVKKTDRTLRLATAVMNFTSVQAISDPLVSVMRAEHLAGLSDEAALLAESGARILAAQGVPKTTAAAYDCDVCAVSTMIVVLSGLAQRLTSLEEQILAVKEVRLSEDAADPSPSSDVRVGFQKRWGFRVFPGAAG